jgi:anti-sigma factor RsiW
MHEPVKGQLEDILRGRVSLEHRAAVEAHLTVCSECAAEVRVMRRQAALVRSLQAAEVPEQSAGFYARVLQRVEAQGMPSFWNLLLDPVFGRRLVYATGTAFLLLATFLVASTGEQPQLARTPVEVMAKPAVVPAAVSEDMQRDREHFLVTLASFSE